MFFNSPNDIWTVKIEITIGTARVGSGEGSSALMMHDMMQHERKTLMFRFLIGSDFAISFSPRCDDPIYFFKMALLSKLPFKQLID